MQNLQAVGRHLVKQQTHGTDFGHRNIFTGKTDRTASGHATLVQLYLQQSDAMDKRRTATMQMRYFQSIARCMLFGLLRPTQTYQSTLVEQPTERLSRVVLVATTEVLCKRKSV